MWQFFRRKKSIPKGLLNVESLVAENNQKVNLRAQGKAVLLFGTAIMVLLFCMFAMGVYFYNARLSYSQASWVHVRNLTPVKNIPAPVTGVLDEIYVSAGQFVQKGTVLASLKVDDVQLNYDETKRNFAEKVIELHCLASLKASKSTFKLPYDAQLLVDEMTTEYNVKYKVSKCERELFKNIRLDQATEEMIASLEDQVRVLDRVVTVRGLITTDLSDVNEEEFPFGVDQEALQKAYRDKYFPLMQFAIAQQDLREVRASYFSRQLEKEEDLNAVIEQTTQEMRYLNRRLRELDQKIKNTYIYASLAGTVVGVKTAEAGFEYSAQETVFKIQPIQSEFQVGIILQDGNASRFSNGTPTNLSLRNAGKIIGVIEATSIGVFRQPNGKLEALFDLAGQAEKNGQIILNAGYKGEGEQRIKANVTVGKERIWNSIYNSMSHISHFIPSFRITELE
ncbi:biotin/lipoyl-binding protein [Amylibacter sp. SFDW26]|uniref:biotin/lipoyl-binding protein n=1 Tax=Amylibacter sp. SFDW26 TaxID=2652722 RepID=UPI0012616634|nr:biotin/lipoyl-binding protein [Amylibacter sp. SFDW26]KAB7614738.1 biotin/lipoyl-binding protein [Amylibacter sp. SFDW26]